MTDEEPGWHARPVDEVLERLGVSSDRGLSRDDAARRLEEHGPNRLREAEGRSWWRILLAQLHSIVVYLLAGGAVLALATQRWPEAVAVLAVIAVNTAIGFVSEWRASRSMAALRMRVERTVRVRREGGEREVPAAEIVPGDLVLLEAGDLVPADLRLVETEGLRINEAPLTGESLPVDKETEPAAAETPLADRRSMAWKGTSVVDGAGVGAAVGTGSRTQLGRIAELAEEAVSTALPLQERLDHLGRRLALVTIGIALVVAGVGLFVRQQEAALVVETALALGIAAIPEGLPIVATIALARGMYVMAKRNAVMNRLPAVEALGATRVIFTDKTGTLTENRMRLRTVVTEAGARTLDDDGGFGDGTDDPDDALFRRALEVGVLCNGASLDEAPGEDNPAGDPTEVALLAAGAGAGVDRAALLERMPELRVEPFEPRMSMMATFHGTDVGAGGAGHGTDRGGGRGTEPGADHGMDGGGDREAAEGAVYVAVKGAPEAVLDHCDHLATGPGPDDRRPLDDEGRRAWLDRSHRLAGQGLRVLAVADRRAASADEEPYGGLRLVGLVGLLDPPRTAVKPAIDTCQSAGIRVEMVTGDQPDTARAIARAVGIVGDADDPESVVMEGRDIGDPDVMDERQRDRVYRANIFARVSPEQKLDLVRVYQDRGDVVAMIGDGVNDAPALKKADIGVAMGARGTEAAKEVADMVLRDDAFETIVAAVEEGRVIFENIRKSIVFMLTTNVAEVLAVTVATVAGWTLPLLPLQILYLNVLTDVFPALALGVGKASGTEMQRPPRPPRESVLTRAHWTEITAWAVLVGACVLGGLLLAEGWLGLSRLQAVTVSFLTLAFGKLWFTFNLRAPDSGIVRNEITRNPFVWAALAFCSVLLVAAVHLPGLSDVLRTSPPGAGGWALLLGASLVPLGVGQVVREVQRARI